MWIILGILAVPLIEIGLFVTVGAQLGLWLTLAWVVVTGVLGVFLLKGVAMMGTHSAASRMRESLSDPLSPIAHQMLVGFAGLFLLLPGFFTDTLGLLLLVRPVRTLLIKLLAGRIRVATVATRGSVVDGEWRDVTPEGQPKPDNPPSEWTRH
jgi:UPF0716 protein FxsA